MWFLRSASAVFLIFCLSGLSPLPGQGLVNLSARGTTSAGAEVRTAGVVVAGEGTKKMLVLAAGPALDGFGVDNALREVRLELFRGTISLATNHGWDRGTEAEAIQRATRAVAATSNAAVRLENSRFIDVRTPVINGILGEADGRVAVIDSVNFDRATRSDRGFDPTRVTPLARFRWNPPARGLGLGNWPDADTTVMPVGYSPPGTTLANYLDPAEALEAKLAQGGVVLPANATEAEQLRQLLVGEMPR